MAGVVMAGIATAQPIIDEEIFPTDPRVIEANSLLEHREGWKRATKLYRESLADDSEDLVTRLRLARVLSWSKRYDEAFTEYYELLDRLPQSQQVRVELGEALSWAGRYEDSERLFLEVLEEEPENHRAALGLARTYSWSGQAKKAQRSYERVLEIADDEDARGELAALDRGEGFGAHAKANSSYVSDSGKFEMFRAAANGSTDLNETTRMLVEAGYTQVSNRGAVGVDHSSGLDLLAGVQRLFGPRLTMRVQAGARRWSTSPNTVLVRAELDYNPSPQTAMGFEASYGDFLERSLSLEAVLRGLHELRARGWLWKELSHSIAGYGYFEASYVSDSTARFSGGLSAEWKPWNELPLNFGTALDATSYTSGSLSYYSPKIDVSASLFAHGAVQLHRVIDFNLRAQVGIGHAQEAAIAGGRSSTGLNYSVEGGPAWHYESWVVALVGRHSQTIRGDTYTSQSVGMTVGRGF